MNKKNNLSGLFLTLLISLSSALLAHNGECDEALRKNDKVQVIQNELSSGDATIKWTDNRIDFIEIISDNGQFMPTIPVLDANSLYLNDLISGSYMINLISNGEILYSKSILVKR
jgi:hypothetical protein